jgi:hypothetical protein
MYKFRSSFLLLVLALLCGACSSRDPRFSDETVYMGGFRGPEP